MEKMVWKRTRKEIMGNLWNLVVVFGDGRKKVVGDSGEEIGEIVKRTLPL